MAYNFCSRQLSVKSVPITLNFFPHPVKDSWKKKSSSYSSVLKRRPIVDGPSVIADLALAAEMFGHMSSGRLKLAMQKIQGRSGSHTVIYKECLLRIVLQSGRIVTAAPYILALERLGLIRVLDTFVAGLVICHMQINRDVFLGLNISALSAVNDGWWREVFAELSRDRDVARRLVVEITETAALCHWSRVKDFIHQMQSLGCRVALDDFGVRRETVEQLLNLKWNFVKIDASCLAQARLSRMAQRQFLALLEQAKQLSSIVIVEGVETAADCQLGLQCGADGLQGYFIEMPA